MLRRNGPVVKSVRGRKSQVGSRGVAPIEGLGRTDEVSQKLKQFGYI